MDLRRKLYDAMMGQPAYQAPVSEFTTPRDVQRERISGALGWDVGPVDSWAPGYATRELGNRAWMLGLALPVGRVPATRRLGTQPTLADDIIAGRLSSLVDSARNFHMNPQRWMRNDLPQIAKGGGAVTGAVGAGGAAGSYLTDTLVHDIDPSTASWNAAMRAASPRYWANPGEPPAWWPGQP